MKQSGQPASSVPSAQCRIPSQTWWDGTHLLFSHLWSPGKQLLFLQFCSSEPSSKSGFPSHIHCTGTHLPAMQQTTLWELLLLNCAVYEQLACRCSETEAKKESSVPCAHTWHFDGTWWTLPNVIAKNAVFIWTVLAVAPFVVPVTNFWTWNTFPINRAFPLSSPTLTEWLVSSVFAMILQAKFFQCKLCVATITRPVTWKQNERVSKQRQFLLDNFCWHQIHETLNWLQYSQNPTWWKHWRSNVLSGWLIFVPSISDTVHFSIINLVSMNTAVSWVAAGNLVCFTKCREEGPIWKRHIRYIYKSEHLTSCWIRHHLPDEEDSQQKEGKSFCLSSTRTKNTLDSKQKLFTFTEWKASCNVCGCSLARWAFGARCLSRLVLVEPKPTGFTGHLIGLILEISRSAPLALVRLQVDGQGSETCSKTCVYFWKCFGNCHKQNFQNHGNLKVTFALWRVVRPMFKRDLVTVTLITKGLACFVLVVSEFTWQAGDLIGVVLKMSRWAFLTCQILYIFECPSCTWFWM